MVLPKCIADQCDRRATRSIFVGGKYATENWFDAQGGQIISHYLGATNTLGLALTDQIERTLCRHTAAGKNVAAVPVGLVFQKRAAERIKSFP